MKGYVRRYRPSRFLSDAARLKKNTRTPPMKEGSSEGGGASEEDVGGGAPEEQVGGGAEGPGASSSVGPSEEDDV